MKPAELTIKEQAAREFMLDTMDPTPQAVTIDELKAAMPKGRKITITKDTVDTINNLCLSSEIRHSYQENLLGFTNVLMGNRSSIVDYANAVRFVSFLLMGYTNKDSWIRVFPRRYEKLIMRGATSKDIAAHISIYKKSKIVIRIQEQAIIPTYLINQDAYQNAINVQAALMVDPKVSHKVRSDAANSLLTHLKQPEVTKMTLDVNVRDDDSIKELRQTTLELVRQQKLMLESGAMNTREVAESKLLIGEFKEV